MATTPRVPKVFFKGIPEYVRTLEKIGKEMTGLSDDEYGDLSVDSVKKINDYIMECGKEVMGFTKPSQVVENSSVGANIDRKSVV